MRSRRLTGQRGFTLIELLIVIAIIGVIAAILVPNLLDAFQKAKQKRTLADSRIIGTAIMTWVTDEVGAAAAGQASTVAMADFSSISLANLEALLSPVYLQEVPPLDGWKSPYEFYLDVANPLSDHVIAIRSLGRDSQADGDTYEPGPFTPTDYDRDILWTDGFFVRWPQGLKVN